MSQFCNPIQSKLTKMKKSMINQQWTFTEQTPLKGCSYSQNKQNQCIPILDRTLTNTNSLKKLDLLEKKKSRKQESINFYQKQLSRRREKQERQLLEEEQMYEAQLNCLQQELISLIRKQQELDFQTENLESLEAQLREREENQNFSLQEISTEILQKIENEVMKAVSGVQSDLLYSIESGQW